jgi:hypothetical protein
MNNNFITAILQSHSFSGGFRPNHLARPTLAAIQ